MLYPGIGTAALDIEVLVSRLASLHLYDVITKRDGRDCVDHYRGFFEDIHSCLICVLCFFKRRIFAANCESIIDDSKNI